MHLRRAAQRVDVLHARARGRAGLARLVGKDHVARLPGEQRFVPSRMRRRLRATRAWPGCGRARCRRGSKAASSPRIASSDRHMAMSACFRSRRRIAGREHAERERGRRAVDERRRILGAEIEIRVEARLGDRLPGRHPAALVDHLGFREAAHGAGHVGERREVAGGADRALLRDDRVQAGIEESDEPLDELDPRPGIVRREGVRAQEHHGPRHVLARRARRRRSRGHRRSSADRPPCRRSRTRWSLNRPTPVLNAYISGASSCIQVRSI